jgi:hypothetical protein
LHCNLLASSRDLRHAAPCRELLPKVLGDLLDIQTKRFQALYRRDVFPLVALDAFDDYFGCGSLFLGFGFCCGSFGRLLL